MLNDKLNKADEIIDKLGNENTNLKRDITRVKESPTTQYGSGSNVYTGTTYAPRRVDSTEVNRLESEVRNLKDQLSDKQQKIR